MKSGLLLLVLVSNMAAVQLSAPLIVEYAGRASEKEFDVLADPFLVERIQVNADIPFDDRECASLAALHIKKTITASELSCACFYLKQTNRWRSIRITIVPEKNGYNITFDLQAQWLVGAVRVHGIWFGKEQLKQRYLLQCGEPFDRSKHDEALRQYRVMFKKWGYCDAIVGGILTYHENDKTVAVDLEVNRGPRFTVSDVAIEYSRDCAELATFHEAVSAHAARILKHKFYSIKRLESFKNTLRTLLMHYGYPFAHVTMRDDRVGQARIRLIYAVDISPNTHVTITGNNHVSYEQLITYIMEDRGMLRYVSAPFLVNMIKQYYVEHGFLQVEVRVRRRPDGWHIMVNEGECIMVHEVAFEGVHALSQDRSRAFFTELLGKPCSEEMLQQAQDALIEWHMRAGFWDAEIMHKRFVVLPQGKTKLILKVQEGAQRVLNHITIESDISDMVHEIQAKLPIINDPIPFDWYSIDEHKEMINRLATICGYQVHIDYTVQETNTGCTLVWRVMRENPTLFGQTIFTGKSLVSQERVKQLLAYQEGQPFDMNRVARTFDRAQEVGVFESIRVFPLIENDPVGNRPVVVDLVADDPLELQMRAGFMCSNTADNTYTLGASLVYKNLTHQADTLKVDADVSLFWRDIQAWYRYPRVRGLPLDTRVCLFDKKYNFLCAQSAGAKSSNTDDIFYTVYRSGGLFYMSYYGAHGLTSEISGGIEGIKITRLFAPCAQAICFDPTFIGVTEPYIVCEPHVSWSHVDDIIDPHCGWMFNVCARGMLACRHAVASCARFVVEQSFFMPIHDRVVVALRARAGYIAAHSLCSLMPSERFYLGGPCSVRAYQQDYAPPLVSYMHTGVSRCVPLGSRIMGAFNGEVRLRCSQRTGLVFFQDVGALWNEKEQQWCGCGATGFGVRYVTPLGPLRFDCGFKNGRRSDESRCTWFLTLGQAF